jgi:hypothetical protein
LSACRAILFCDINTNTVKKIASRETTSVRKLKGYGSNGLKRKRWPVLITSHPVNQPNGRERRERCPSRGDCIAETVGKRSPIQRSPFDIRDSANVRLQRMV